MNVNVSTNVDEFSITIEGDTVFMLDGKYSYSYYDNVNRVFYHKEREAKNGILILAYDSSYNEMYGSTTIFKGTFKDTPYDISNLFVNPYGDFAIPDYGWFTWNRDEVLYLEGDSKTKFKYKFGTPDGNNYVNRTIGLYSEDLESFYDFKDGRPVGTWTTYTTVNSSQTGDLQNLQFDDNGKLILLTMYVLDYDKTNQSGLVYSKRAQYDFEGNETITFNNVTNEILSDGEYYPNGAWKKRRIYDKKNGVVYITEYDANEREISKRTAKY